MANRIKRSQGGIHQFLKFIDVNEQYGRHIIEHFAKKIKADIVCDLGVGTGEDLLRFKKFHAGLEMHGVDYLDKLKNELLSKNINLHVKNIENENLDFTDESVDVFIANQILEHVKEIFWINDQVARKLKVGGYFIVGLPNISSFHNRILFIFGKQPTQMKTYSAHIRGFAHREIINFFNVCFPGGYELVDKKGAQFYPFPKIISRFLSFIFPSLSFSNFYLFKKIRKYDGEFLEYPVAAELETNFFVG